MKYVRVFALAAALAASCTPAIAQWQTPVHSVPIGRGGGSTGFSSAVPSAPGLPLVSSATPLATDPSFQVLGTAGGGTNCSTPSGTCLDNILGIPGTGYLRRNSTGYAVAPASQMIAASATQDFPASGSVQSTTGTITAGTALSIASAIDFKNGQGIRIDHAGSAFAVNSPTALTVTPTGTTGGTTYTYTIASIDGSGGVGVAIANVSTSTGNATLSGTNYNLVSWTFATGTTPGGYAIYGRVSGSLVLLAVVPAGLNSWKDTGTAAINPYTWLPTTPQSVSLSSWLISSVVSGAGTTSLVLANSVVTAATSQAVVHDDTAAIQAGLNAGSLIVPPGAYSLSSDIQVPANRWFWVQNGATITQNGGRFTGNYGATGGGNVHFQIDGAIKFQFIRDRADIPAWDTGGVPLGGVIEFGGTVGVPANGIWIDGTGSVVADWPWPGSPPSGFTNVNYQLFRKGPALFYVNNAHMNRLDISGIWGENLYHQSSGGEVNIQIIGNHVHEVAFDAINFNTFGTCSGCLMQGNYVQNSWQCIEASSGTIDNNTCLTATLGFLTGAGGGGSPLRITNNVFNAMTTQCVNVSFSPTTIENIQIIGNSCQNPGGQGYIINNISTFLFINNSVYNSSLAGTILFNSNADRGYVTGNVIRGTGTLVNNGTNITLGTNPQF